METAMPPKEKTAEQLAAEKAEADRLAAEKAEAEKAEADRLAAEAEKQAAELAEAERLAAEEKEASMEADKKDGLDAMPVTLPAAGAELDLIKIGDEVTVTENGVGEFFDLYTGERYQTGVEKKAVASEYLISQAIAGRLTLKLVG